MTNPNSSLPSEFIDSGIGASKKEIDTDVHVQVPNAVAAFSEQNGADKYHQVLNVPDRNLPSSSVSSVALSVEEALARIDDAAGVNSLHRKTNGNIKSGSASRVFLPSSSSSSSLNPGCCYIPRRYIVTVLTFLAFAVMYGIRGNLSIAIVVMTSNKTVIRNGVEEIEKAPFNWNSIEKGEILGGFFYGYIVTQIPGGWLASRFGAKYVVMLGTLVASVFTLLAPVAANLGKTALIIALVIQGLGQGVVLPAVHAILGNWAPKKEKTLISAIAYAGLYFGAVIAMPISSFLGDLGWSFIFYFFGGVGVVFCLLWQLFFVDKPENMCGISKQELNMFKHEKADRGEHLSIPWLYIFRSKEVWSIVTAHFCTNYGFYTMLTALPEILEKFLHFSYHTAGILAALPHFAMGCSLTFGGPLVDFLRARCKRLTVTRARKIFCCSGFIGAGLTTLLVIVNTYTWLRLVGLILSLGFSGFAFLSFSANMLDVAPQYAGHIMGLSNTIATVPGIVEPLIAGAIVTDELAWQWRIVFYIIAGIYFFGALQFAIFAKGEVLYWAKRRETADEKF